MQNRLNSRIARAIGLASVLFSLLPRLIGVGWDLPRIYHPDEPYYIGRVLKMLQTGDLNPHWFQYPSLFLYLLPAAGFVFLQHVSSGMFVKVSEVNAARMVTVGTGTTQIPY